MPEKMVCPSKTYLFGEFPNPVEIDASGFVCYRPEDIEPFLERCGK